MKVIASTVPMEWRHEMDSECIENLFKELRPRKRQPTEMGKRQQLRWDHTGKMLSRSIKWPRLTCSRWLGMLEVWPRVWDSLLYLFLVSSTDTCRQLSRWPSHDRSLRPGFVFILSLTRIQLESSAIHRIHS